MTPRHVSFCVKLGTQVNNGVIAGAGVARSTPNDLRAHRALLRGMCSLFRIANKTIANKMLTDSIARVDPNMGVPVVDRFRLKYIPANDKVIARILMAYSSVPFSTRKDLGRHIAIMNQPTHEY